MNSQSMYYLENLKICKSRNNSNPLFPPLFKGLYACVFSGIQKII